MSATPGKPVKMLESLSYLEIQGFYVEKGTRGLEPHICFSHRPDPEGVARRIKVYLDGEQATELAEAVMSMLQEINERRNPHAAFESGGTAVTTMANVLFDDGGGGDNPMFDEDEDT